MERRFGDGNHDLVSEKDIFKKLEKEHNNIMLSDSVKEAVHV